MTSIAVKPYQITDCVLTLGSNNYEAHASKIELVPTVTKAKFKGSTPAATFSFASAPEWLLNLTYAQDWETASSLSRFLHEHVGEEIDVTFEPRRGGPAITATIVIEPGAIGGDVDAVAGASVALGVNGQPTLEPVA